MTTWFIALIVSSALLAGLLVAVLVRLHQLAALVERRGATTQRQVAEVVRRKADIATTKRLAGEQRLEELVSRLSDQLTAATRRDVEFRRGLVGELAEEAREQRQRAAEIEDRVNRLHRDVRSARDALKRVRGEVQALPRNLETLHQTEATLELRLRFPEAGLLPLTGGWRAAPTTLLRLLEEIEVQDARTVVECGSGVSTLWVAHLLRRRGAGHCIALEHEEQYLEQTRSLIALHGLEEWATVRHAPLVPAGDGALWYDEEQAKDLRDVDVLFVDGPPGATGHLARFPALPIMVSRLREGASIVLDDSARDQEQEILRRWVETGWVETYDSSPEHKGWTVLRLSNQDTASGPA